jgi:endonuclease/exonuclease/phosphatase family metal-dependent hydrolase
VRVVTWNMGGNTVGSGLSDAAWRYLFHEDEGLQADVALVQEAVLPASMEPERVVFARAWESRQWGTGVVVKPGLRVKPVAYDQAEDGRAVVARVEIDGDSWLVASVHARLVNGVVIPALTATVKNLFDTALPVEGRWIFGGDLNTCRLAETLWPGHGHGEFFDGLDRSRRAVNVYWKVHQREESTYTHPRTRDATQADHIFVDPVTAERVTAASVWDDRGLSDHKPLVIEIAI